MNKSLSKPDCTLPGQTIVNIHNSGTGQGQSEKSGTVGNYVFTNSQFIN